MASLVVDTHNLVNHLESFGYNKRQAEGFVEALQKLDTSSLTTKEDLKQEIQTVKQQVRDSESRLELKIAEIKSDMLKWLLPILLSQTGLTVALIKLL